MNENETNEQASRDFCEIYCDKVCSKFHPCDFFMFFFVNAKKTLQKEKESKATYELLRT